MARGEQSKSRPQGPGLAIGAVFVACCVAALTLVATTSRGCAGCGPAWGPGMPLAEPFVGAAAAFGELGWRDASRGRATWAAPSAPDAAAAERALEDALTERGYVPAEGTGAAARSLPFELRTDALEGVCGVVAVLGVGSAVLTGIEDEQQGAVRAPDPSAVTIARCGAGIVRASGLGQAVVRTWQLPGITPADVEAIGLSPDVVLAHAEAEALLRARGLVPLDVLAREEVTGRASISPPVHAGAAGCTAWVGVVTGAGRAETSGGLGLLGRDYALDRAMLGGASCAGGTGGATGAAAGPSSTHTALVDDGGDGLTVIWRPYGAPAGGPTRTPAAGAIVASVGAARVVPIAELPSPTPIPAAAP